MYLVVRSAVVLKRSEGHTYLQDICMRRVVRLLSYVRQYAGGKPCQSGSTDGLLLGSSPKR